MGARVVLRRTVGITYSLGGGGREVSMYFEGVDKGFP
jgi:hypothetical protein